MIQVRWARGGDVSSIRELVRPLAGNTLTPKDPVAYYEALQQFRVAQDPDVPGRIIGCGALHVMWDELGEVRTLAVHPDFAKRGLVAGSLRPCSKTPGYLACAASSASPSRWTSSGTTVSRRSWARPLSPTSTRSSGVRMTKVLPSSSTWSASSPTRWATPGCCVCCDRCAVMTVLTASTITVSALTARRLLLLLPLA